MSVSFSELTRVSTRIGLLSFGGPAAQIGLMHTEYVKDRDWLTEDEYLHALSFCMLLPGPEAMQLATYTGWRLKGMLGGLIAGGLFVLPGAVLILALALLYGQFGALDTVQSLFLGVKATVIIIVLQALYNISKRALKTPVHWGLAGLAFVALFIFNLPFPIIVLAAGLTGWYRPFTTVPAADPPPVTFAWKTLLIGGALWVAPIVVAAVLGASFFVDIGLFFSKLAVVTFGGAYAVLSYMTQTVVSDYGWISTEQMMDALGLAETTPGPLILVTEFVAALAGAAQNGMTSAVLAACLALWVTFVPCFIWIFIGAPYIDLLAQKPRLSNALAAITAAVVGVIANLSIWFAAHVFFDTVTTAQWGIISVLSPSGLNITAIGLAGVAAILLLWRKIDLFIVLLICAALGLAVNFV